MPPVPPDTFHTGICPQRSRQALVGLVGRSIYLTKGKAIREVLHGWVWDKGRMRGKEKSW